MPDSSAPNPDFRDLRIAARVSAISVVWTMIASSAAVVIGFADASLVLIAFGLTGILDALGSTVLVIHFRHAIRHESISERGEHLAFVLVSVGLIAVALSTIASSVDRLIVGGEPKNSIPGIVIAAISVVVLGVLARFKLRMGKAIPSQALVADGRLSFTGCLLAVVTLLGNLLTANNVTWADPIAAIVVAVGALAFVFQGIHEHLQD